MAQPKTELLKAVFFYFNHKTANHRFIPIAL